MRFPTYRGSIALAALAAACLSPQVAHAQDAEIEEAGGRDRASASGVHISPYIEASQVVSAELAPGDDVLTYTQLAAGVDASISGRNSAASASLRYEHQIGYGDAGDVDTVSGIARASLAPVPRHLTVEAGALAARTRINESGGTSLGGIADDEDSTSQIYSAYAGPTFQAAAGDVAVTGGYRIGYTRVEEPDAFVRAPGAAPVDVFDDSLSQSAQLHAGIAPNTVAPIGVGVGAGWNRQDVSNLDQRVDDRHVRADVTVPVSPTLALVGGVGYEDVEVTARDAVRNANGVPVVGPDGRYITDDNSARLIAYQTDGLIWDVGVMWRPSRRTSLEAYVGRRYGSTTYYGSLSYAPSSRTSLNVGVYDNITGFGGAIIDTLADLSTDFEAFRNPITGDLGACVAALEGNNCALGRLGAIRSAVFRSRGISASLNRSAGRTSYGIAGGYDQREYIGAAGTVLASVNGIEDETVWLAAYAGQELDLASSVRVNAYANWFNSGFTANGEVMAYTTTLAYDRLITRGLSGVVALGLDGITSKDVPDFATASALLGLRYTFN